MSRYEVSASQWRRIEGSLPGRLGYVGVAARDNRDFANGLWMLRSGPQWKDLPARDGNWKSAHRCFNRWAKPGLWERIFQVLL